MTANVLAAVLAASIGPVAFKAPGGFVILSRDGKVLDTIRTLDGKTPDSLAVSPDGKMFVFTAFDQKAEQPLLYRASRTGEAALLGNPIGYHAQPSFTNDGKWVVFIHHPDRTGGAVGRHAPRAYGQLWKVRTDGTGLAQITTTAGCKLYPDARAPQEVAVTHADCAFASSIETVAGAKVRVVAPMSSARTQLPRIAPDGKSVIFVRLHRERFEVIHSHVKGDQVIAAADSVLPPAEMAWGESGDILIQVRESVFRINAGEAVLRQVLDLNEVLQ